MIKNGGGGILSKSKYYSKTDMPSKYIFAYFNRTSYLNDYLKLVSKQLGLPVVVIHETAINASEDYIKDYSAGPGDFLRYIKNAEYVFTDSFHGLAFSIIFEKKFVVSAKRGCDLKNKDIRKIELCERLHLEDRILWDDSVCLNDIDDISYERCNKELLAWRDEAAKYILSALEGHNN